MCALQTRRNDTEVIESDRLGVDAAFCVVHKCDKRPTEARQQHRCRGPVGQEEEREQVVEQRVHDAGVAQLLRALDEFGLCGLLRKVARDTVCKRMHLALVRGRRRRVCTRFFDPRVHLLAARGWLGGGRLHELQEQRGECVDFFAVRQPELARMCTQVRQTQQRHEDLAQHPRALRGVVRKQVAQYAEAREP